MRCTNCGNESTAGKKFCATCGSALPRRCSKCGSKNAPTSAFCEDCGAALAGNAASAVTGSSDAALTTPEIRITPEQPGASTAADGERKTVTALFADIKGSTELMEDLDPEEARAIIDPAVHIMVEAVRRYEGYVVQSRGDGIFALFGAPAAYEDHPQRALYAALQMQRELREHGQRRAAAGAHAPAVRVGVNTGEVVVRSVEIGGKIEYTPIGHTANLASRLETMAPAGSIAVSEYTRKLCEGYFELRSLGPMAVKGIRGPINVYEVTGLGALRTHFELAARRGLTKFVGRERELEQMRHALDSAVAGHGQVVAVMAEAGTGKSRLFHEFKAAIPPTCKVLEAYSVSHGKASAWLPVLELLRKYFDIADGDNAGSRREKVRGALTLLDPALQDTQPYLFGLLGIVEGPDPIAQMDPQIKKQRTLDAIKRIMLRESSKRPLIVIFEDLHWIDEQTQALLDLLVDGVANARVLLLVNYRPEYRHEWGNKSHYVQIGLKPLGRENAEELLTALLGDVVELQPLKLLIVERTGGNPFFIEEMVQALFDEGTLVRNGVVTVTRSLSQLRLPATVQGILAARIDRLSAEQKELLQTMAVIGREAPDALIMRMSALPEMQLERMLAELQAAEFIYEHTELGDTEYVFKHALTQEVAYNSLLIERRKLIHERAGQALEAIFAEHLDDHVAQLAHHYRFSDNIDKAVEYLGRAGRQALQRGAHSDAIRSTNAAIELLQSFPDGLERIQRELPLQFTIGPAFIALKGWGAPEMEKAFTRARELCRQLGDPPEVFPALIGLCSTHMVRGEMRAAKEIAEQLLQLAEKTGDPHLLLWARSQMANTSFHRGDLLSAREHEEAAIALYDRERDAPRRYLGIDVGVADLAYGGWIWWHLGYPDQALKKICEACQLAEALSHPDSIAFAFGYQCSLRWLRAETEEVQKLAERQIVLCTEYGLATFLAGANFYLGWTMALQGHGKEGIDRIQKSIATQRATGFGMLRPSNLAMLVDACLVANRFDDAQIALTEAFTTAEDHEEYCHLPELYRLRGELLLKQGRSGAARVQGCFERAIELARNRSAKSWELRATTSLARLLDKQSKRDEARTMLEEIYSWFTEGFDTADLQDAKALLDQLAN